VILRAVGSSDIIAPGFKPGVKNPRLRVSHLAYPGKNRDVENIRLGEYSPGDHEKTGMTGWNLTINNKKTPSWLLPAKQSHYGGQ
jgi:hypothetical protein